MNAALDRRWLTNQGVLLTELEERIASLTGVRHCVAFCNATLALELLLEALGLQGQVIVPSFTFVATAHAVLRQRLTPVFCDIDPVTHSMDIAAVERAIGPHVSAILAVHLWGRACDVDALSALASAKNIPLLFDAAHAFASTLDGKPVGSFGTAEVFSFHATKFVNALEGGAVTTNDSALAERLRLSRNFGFADEDTVVSLGTNAKMSEISAAMGLTSLDSLSDYLEVNARNHAAYEKALEGLEGIRFVSGGRDPRRVSNLQYVVIEIDAERFGLTRDQLLAVLRSENVIARRYFYPGCHRMEPYRSSGIAHQPLPNTERATERVLLLPSGTAVDVETVDKIGGLIALTVRDAAAIRQVQTRLAGRRENMP